MNLDISTIKSAPRVPAIHASMSAHHASLKQHTQYNLESGAGQVARFLQQTLSHHHDVTLVNLHTGRVSDMPVRMLDIFLEQLS